MSNRMFEIGRRGEAVQPSRDASRVHFLHPLDSLGFFLDKLEQVGEALINSSDEHSYSFPRKARGGPVLDEG
jgi:hypothetical protein